MSFTDYYFNFGYNSALEKVAKDEGMSAGQKAALGLGGLGALGAGAYFGGDALQDAAQYITDNAEPGMLADTARNALSGAGQFLNENVTSNVDDVVGAARNAIYNAPAMASQAGAAGREMYNNAANRVIDTIRSTTAPDSSSLVTVPRGAMDPIDTSVDALPGSIEEVRDAMRDYYAPMIDRAGNFLQDQKQLMQEFYGPKIDQAREMIRGLGQ